MKNRGINRKSQVTLFIIIAIIVVAIIVILFLFGGKIFGKGVPRELSPVYSYYISCIEEQASNGAKLLGEKGGRIEDISFSPGSEYMPFSSHLGFMGTGIPYWFYISGNGIAKEQVPTKSGMQEELNNFVKDNMKYCDFSDFENKGFQVILGEAKVESEIRGNSINVNVDQDIDIKFGNTNWNGKTHSLNVNSNLGNFYDLAMKIYNSEKQDMFLENYGVDVLKLYAPGDGVSIGCNPKIWGVNEVRANLTQALEANTAAIKIKGDYYKLNNPDNKYFVKDIGEKTSFNVNFMYSRYWPTKIEVWPSEDGIMKANPVGFEQGMAMLGFCYVPYHFVYDFDYPVLVQVYSNDEMFQFPIAVIIDKNKPRQAVNSSGFPNAVPELCQHKNANVNVYSYNNHLEPVEADIKFKCFDTSCDIGSTKITGSDAVLNGNFPQCANGYVIASADGYETKKIIVSTLNTTSVNMVLFKKYKLDIDIKENGGEMENGEFAVVTFTKNNSGGITLSYPEQKQVELTEGQYEIKAYTYKNSSINLKGTTTQKCIDIPKSGIEGYFGSTEQKCFDMQIPDQNVGIAVSGGGVQNYYIGESQLENNKNISISVQDFGTPTSLEELQTNYNAVDVTGLDVSFK